MKSLQSGLYVCLVTPDPVGEVFIKYLLVVLLVSLHLKLMFILWYKILALLMLSEEVCQTMNRLLSH